MTGFVAAGDGFVFLFGSSGVVRKCTHLLEQEDVGVLGLLMSDIDNEVAAAVREEDEQDEESVETADVIETVEQEEEKEAVEAVEAVEAIEASEAIE